MPRIPYLIADHVGPAALVDAIRARRGGPLGALDRLLLHSPPVAEGWNLFFARLRGQLELPALPRELAMCAVANKGRLMRPMLVSRLEDQTGQVFAQYHPQMVRQVVSERAAQLTVTGLKNVVSTNGTALRARLDHYTVAGKTGTAEKPLNGAYTDEYVSSFFGFFPADKPEVCISVVLDEPEKVTGYYGGTTAAPIFKIIAEQVAKYLKIRPDREVPSGEFGTLATAIVTE